MNPASLESLIPNNSNEAQKTASFPQGGFQGFQKASTLPESKQGLSNNLFGEFPQPSKNLGFSSQQNPAPAGDSRPAFGPQKKQVFPPNSPANCSFFQSQNNPSPSTFATQTPQQNQSLFGSFQPQFKANSGLSNSQSSSLLTLSSNEGSNPWLKRESAEPQSKVIKSGSLFQPSTSHVSEEESKIFVNKDKAPKSKLSCIVCYEKFNTTKIIPKVLLCGHSICSLCLEKMFILKSSIACPLCSSIDQRKVLQIPINYAVFEMCEESRAIDLCREHNREIGLFCKVDHNLLCFNCVVQHSAHEMLLLNDGYVEEVINKKKAEIREAEEKFEKKIDFCEKNLQIIIVDRAKIEGLVNSHIKAYENAQKELIEIFGRATEALRESFNNKYKSIFERNQILTENYNSFTVEFKKKKEEVGKLANDFNNMKLSDKINCEILRLDEEMKFPEIENVEDVVKSLESPINYKEEILEKFNEYFK